MNRDAKILNKILANESNNIYKRSYTMTKRDSSQVHKNGSTYANECDNPYKEKKRQNHMISTDAEKHLTNFH